MLRVRATAPTRIDMAGGTLDLWPIPHLLDHKATVNVGVTLDASVEVSESEDGRFHFRSHDQDITVAGNFAEVCATATLPLFGLLLQALWRPDLPALNIATAAKSPAGAGLGGSSCLGIAFAAALWRARQLGDGLALPTDAELVQLVQDVEARVIHAPTGIQDYWGGLRGQINILRYPFGKVTIETLPPSRLPGLAEQLILCFSGKSRASAINNWEIFKRLFDGDQQLRATFNAIGTLAEGCANAALAGDLASALELSEQEWQLRTQLWPAIATVDTKRLDQAAKGAGAQFSRVCGAGGGGVMAVFAPPDRHRAVKLAMADAGGSILAASVATAGLKVEVL